jgi:hypothetical protein
LSLRRDPLAGAATVTAAVTMALVTLTAMVAAEMMTLAVTVTSVVMQMARQAVWHRASVGVWARTVVRCVLAMTTEWRLVLLQRRALVAVLQALVTAVAAVVVKVVKAATLMLM